MKRIVVTLFAAIGVIVCLFASCTAVTRAIGIKGYAESIQAQFGSPEAVADLAALYGKVERSGTELGFVKWETTGAVAPPVEPTFPRIRKIPKSWLPARFTSLWGREANTRDPEIFEVLAYYDERDALIGIFFQTFRSGCFLSRDAMRGPPWGGTVRRLADKPLYVSSWVAEGQH